MMKRYKTGMFGGKFLPLHLGHGWCIEVASLECERVFAILFHGGAEEQKICRKCNVAWLSPEERMKQLHKIASRFENVIPAEIDISDLRLDDGSEDWDAETPLVIKLCGNKLDAVYSSEESYSDYFSRAYPEPEHRLVDIRRTHYPISGTQIRSMDSKEEINKWMI